ncbi:uncharacterized protein CEXT_163051 [Caerostris extrusa]|uniref:Uncharacterized protein n=1 Tax=Caerostris extrusa TaxID=172846 RepID=A0AAV4Y763_CAEEX|nr:uncharacterized protein CEXT_163051 [Caerostris extrusa]
MGTLAQRHVSCPAPSGAAPGDESRGTRHHPSHVGQKTKQIQEHQSMVRGHHHETTLGRPRHRRLAARETEAAFYDPYNDWAAIDFSPNDLMNTAHELKKETLRLAISRQDILITSQIGSLIQKKKSATCSADSEMADSDRYYDTGSAVNSRSSSFSSGPVVSEGPIRTRGCTKEPEVFVVILRAA